MEEILAVLLFVILGSAWFYVNRSVIRSRLQSWLAIDELYNKAYQTHQLAQRLDMRTQDLVNIGVDVHFKSPHMVLIYSKLNGGQLRHIEVDLKDISQLMELVNYLKKSYGTREVTIDYFPGREMFNGFEPE